MKQIIKLSFVLGLSLILIGCQQILNTTDTTETDQQDSSQSTSFTFKKESSWGPCPGNSICHQSVELDESGKLVATGEVEKDVTLPQSEMKAIKQQIETSQLMTKSCDAAIVADYSATYTIFYSGQEKIIRFPGCKEELAKIDSIIDKQLE